MPLTYIIIWCKDTLFLAYMQEFALMVFLFLSGFLSINKESMRSLLPCTKQKDALKEKNITGTYVHSLNKQSHIIHNIYFTHSFVFKKFIVPLYRN